MATKELTNTQRVEKAVFELKAIDLRTVPKNLRPVVKDARDSLSAVLKDEGV